MTLRVTTYTPDNVQRALSGLGWATRVSSRHDCAFGIEGERDGWRLAVVSFGQGLSVGVAHDDDDIRGIGANNLGTNGSWSVSLPWYALTTIDQATRFAEGIQHLATITAALGAARTPRLEACVDVPTPAVTIRE